MECELTTKNDSIVSTSIDDPRLVNCLKIKGNQLRYVDALFQIISNFFISDSKCPENLELNIQGFFATKSYHSKNIANTTVDYALTRFDDQQNLLFEIKEWIENKHIQNILEDVKIKKVLVIKNFQPTVLREFHVLFEY